MKPSPRHSKCSRSSKTSAITASARGLPSHGTTRAYWFSTSQRPLGELGEEHLDRLQDVQRLEPGRRRPACRSRAGMNSNGRAPITRRDVPGADEAVELQVGRVEQRAQRRHDRDVVAEAGEVPYALGLRARISVSAVDGRGRLEADREEHDLALGVLAGDRQRVQRRVDHPHVGARGLGLQQAAA